MSRASVKIECEAVGRLIQPTGSVAWLTEYFLYWASPLATEWSIAEMQPSRAEMKDQLIRISQAAYALNEALSNPITTAFLELQHGFIFKEKFAGLDNLLRTVSNCAYVSAKSPALSNSKGKTRSGRGATAVPGHDNPKVFCALIVAEAWKFVQGKNPPPKNETAAKAAMAFWLLSGGARPKGWGKTREGAWRPYFERARSPAHVARRAQCLRILYAVKSRPDLLGN